MNMRGGPDDQGRCFHIKGFSPEIRLYPSVNREGKSAMPEKKKDLKFSTVPAALKKITSTIDREYTSNNRF